MTRIPRQKTCPIGCTTENSSVLAQDHRSPCPSQVAAWAQASRGPRARSPRRPPSSRPTTPRKPQPIFLEKIWISHSCRGFGAKNRHVGHRCINEIPKLRHPNSRGPQNESVPRCVPGVIKLCQRISAPSRSACRRADRTDPASGRPELIPANKIGDGTFPIYHKVCHFVSRSAPQASGPTTP